ncbi:hypothetical protein [Candidatus Minimicrobia naudis]
MKKTYQITEAGKADLEKELAELKGRRGEIAEKIAAQRETLATRAKTRNMTLHAEEQGLVETRILEIEDILQNAEIIKSNGSSSVGLKRVQLNCNVQKEPYPTQWLVQLKLIHWLDESQISRQLVKN